MGKVELLQNEGELHPYLWTTPVGGSKGMGIKKESAVTLCKGMEVTCGGGCIM